MRKEKIVRTMEVGREVVAGGWKPLIGMSPGSPWKLRQPLVRKEDDAGAVCSYGCRYTLQVQGT